LKQRNALALHVRNPSTLVRVRSCSKTESTAATDTSAWRTSIIHSLRSSTSSKVALAPSHQRARSGTVPLSSITRWAWAPRKFLRSAVSKPHGWVTRPLATLSIRCFRKRIIDAAHVASDASNRCSALPAFPPGRCGRMGRSHVAHFETARSRDNPQPRAASRAVRHSASGLSWSMIVTIGSDQRNRGSPPSAPSMMSSRRHVSPFLIEQRSCALDEPFRAGQATGMVVGNSPTGRTGCLPRWSMSSRRPSASSERSEYCWQQPALPSSKCGMSVRRVCQLLVIL